MLKFIGVLLMITGVLFGIWAGLWWAFVGGIMQVIDGLNHFQTTGAKDIAVGVLRVMSAGFIGVVSFWVISMIGVLFFAAGDSPRRRSW